MDRGLQSARRAGDDDARDEHDPASAGIGRVVLSARSAGSRRCIVHVQIGIEAIRALFGAEKPPVLDVEWDEAGYVEQRLRAYRDALDALALVLTIPHEGDDLGAASQGGATMRCVRTGDRAVVDLGDLGDIGESDDPMGNAVRADVGRALHRVFADANAWRRSLLPAYFERHRAWRSIAGGPIQH